MIAKSSVGVAIALALLGCSAEDGKTDSAQVEGGAGGAVNVSLDAPDNADDLVPWLEAGNYKDWLAEPDYHNSAGPHGNAVKVFYSKLAADSIAAGDTELAPGSAVVKELTADGNLYGWGVYVRGRQGAGSAGVYFYELIKPSKVYGDAYGSSECAGCHSTGSLVLSDLTQIAP